MANFKAIVIEKAEGGDAPRRRHWHYGAWDSNISWVAFMDAGRAWSHTAGLDEETAVDAGFGVLVGRVGVYGAVPLEGGRGVSVFVRLNPRF